MSTILFLCGAGSGALITVMLMILTMRTWSASATKQGQAVIDSNKRSYDLLEARNKIGEREAAALETIAEWCRANWKTNSP